MSGRNKGWFKPGQHWRQAQAFRDKAWLEAEYLGKGRSTGEIAIEFGVTDSAIIFWLCRHGIPRRSISQARALKRWGSDGADNPMFGRNGAANPNFKDGSSPERQRLYAQAVGRAFIRAVLARDGYKCVRCESPKLRRGYLQAHHLRPWAGHEAGRFDPANGVTLCRPCHSWVHSKANGAGEFLA